MHTLQPLFDHYWPYIVFVLSLVLGAAAAIHAAMTKSDVRAAIGWVGVTIFSPLLGSAFYFVAGVNRIRRTRLSQQRDEALGDWGGGRDEPVVDVLAHSAAQFVSLKRVGDCVSRFRLTPGNEVDPLAGGDQAYPAMLAGIRSARRSIALQTYIFDSDAVGQEFVEALSEARARGVEIRVLIDAIGVHYSRPSIIHALEEAQVPHARFNTNPMGVMRMPYANLRSHRKILVIDSQLGFTGGMNLRAAFTRAVAGEAMSLDTHFRVRGAIVEQLLAVFRHDWTFTTGETLSDEVWTAQEAHPQWGGQLARGIPSGPDREEWSNRNLLLGALAVAQHHVRIQSPYFLPDQVLIGALATAARRGVSVDIVIPGRNNLRLVNCAMTAQLDQVLRTGCRVWRAAGPFDHSKLAAVDGAWSYIGSSNLDPRSLRLNFEFDLEVYGRDLAAWIEARIGASMESATEETLERLRARPFIKRLRDKIIWLATPYL